MGMMLALMVCAAGAHPQPFVVRGSVTAAIGSTPIAAATVEALRSRTSVSTDHLGRFALEIGTLPDTIVVRAIGWRPDTIRLERAPSAPISVTLERSPAVLSDLMVTATRTTPELAEAGRWRMPMAAARAVPPAVEPDVYRALALIPAVNFSSPLSARPLLRGYDAQDVTTRIDGFESLNLYHLGRIFSSFPADAAEEITVAAAPYTSAAGGSVAGLIDIQGRTGPKDRTVGGGSLSYGALSAFGGGGNDQVRYFATARVFYWKSLELIPKLDIPYRFEDVYAGALFGPADRPKGRLTVFATEDRAGHVADASFLHWSNIVLGGRWRVVDAGRTSVDVGASANDSHQRGENVPGLHQIASTNLANRFGRLSAFAELVRQSARTRLTAGVSGGARRIVNRISPHHAGAPTLAGPAAFIETTRPEVAGWVSVSQRLGPVATEVALRGDRTAAARSIQPRLHARWFAADGIELAAGVGRTSRLYHLLSEPRSEPDFDFLDFWLDSGDSIPAARVDHASIDLNLGREPLIARISAYASRGRGLGELRPDTDQHAGPLPFFRFGRSRTQGLEAQVAYRGDRLHPYSLSVTYVLARSERDWGGTWVPWSLDRRHQGRAFGQLRTGRLNWFAAIDAASGLPITPRVADGVPADVPGAPGAASDRAASPVYGTENSLGTSGTFRIDGGMAWAFERRGRRFSLGVSVINILGSAVAPFGDIDGPGTGPLASYRGGGAAPYRRLFRLPPIPTLTLRAEF